MPSRRLPDFADIAAPTIRFGRTVTSLKTGDAPVAVAFSGGADSTGALFWAIATFGAGRVIALHFHHGVRGDTADRDREHCRGMAEENAVRFLSEKNAGASRADETSLRDARRRFFMNAIRTTGAAALVQGHHADDVAETLLMRLGRGSGGAGLAAPRPVSELPDGTPVLRPFIRIRKSTIAGRLRAAGVTWAHDETNDDPAAATRNRIRSAVIPAWIEALPGDAVAGAGRTRERLEEDDDALMFWAELIFREASLPVAGLDLEKIRRLPPAVVRRVARLFLNRHAPELDLAAAAFDALPGSLCSGSPFRMSLGRYGFLQSDGRAGIIQTLEKQPDATLPVPGAVFFPDGSKITAKFDSHQIDDDSRDVAIRVTGPLSCGPCRDGERYGPKKIREAMAGRKISALNRPRLPVVRDGDTAIWCPGLPPARSHRPDTCEIRALRLTWTYPEAALPPLCP